MEKQPSQIAADLTGLVHGEVFADIIHRVAFSTDASSYRIVPQCVVAPRDVQDVAAVVQYAAAHGLAVAALRGSPFAWHSQQARRPPAADACQSCRDASVTRYMLPWHS